MRYLSVIVCLFVSLTVLGQADADPRGRKQDNDKDKQQPQNQQQQQRRAERMLKNMKENKVPEGVVRIQMIKTAYITKKLELTTDQSSKFWPLYNQYQVEMFEVQRQIRINNSPLQNNGKDQVMNEFALEDKRTEVKRRYATEFMKIMPAEKLSLLYKSEKEFNDEAVQKLKEKRTQADN